MKHKEGKGTSVPVKATESKKNSKATVTEKKSSTGIGDKVVTAKVFAGMIGANVGTKFWVSKKYSGDEKRTMNDWSKEFIAQGAIHKTPSILVK